MSPAERIFASFDRVYVLNLPDRADRRSEMAGELARIGTDFGDPRVRLFPAIRPAEAGGFPGIGAHGAFLSHLGALREAREVGDRRILILEDDCDFAAGFETLLPAALDRLDAVGFDIFHGGYALPSGEAGGDRDATPLFALDRSTPVQMAHFIGFGPAVIDPLIVYLEAMLHRPPGSPEGGPMHIDGAYNWYRRSHPGLVTWAARPQLGHQRPSRSDISAPGPLDRLPAPLGRLARRVRRWAKRPSR